MNLPNRLSLVRLLLSPVFVLSILYYRGDSIFLSNLPLAIFLTAIMTDAVDGFIARRYSQKTSLGVILDPLADKLLLTASFITLAFTTTIPPYLRIPPWVLIIVLTRDIFILLGAFIIYLVFEYVEFIPSILGKVTTFFQMVTVISVLIRFSYSYVLWTAAAVLTVLSGIQYLIRAGRILNGRTQHV